MMTRFQQPETTTESSSQSKGPFSEKTSEELREFIILTAYLYVCFAALIYLKAAILQAQGVAYAPLGLAIVKARSLHKIHANGTCVAHWRTIQSSSTHCSNAPQVVRLPPAFGCTDVRRGDCYRSDARSKGPGLNVRNSGRDVPSDHRDNAHHILDPYPLLRIPVSWRHRW
jgi:hypothetical protein